MNTPSILLSLVSLTTLVLGLYAWRLTSSRPIVFNGLFGSAGFLIVAYGFASRQTSALTLVIPFIITMLLAGRALGFYWRTLFKGEKELRLPSHLMGASAVMSMAGTVVAYMSQ
jgi:hypothetical protein